MTEPTCRIKATLGDPFELEMVKQEDGLELRDPTGKLPLEVFDEINAELIKDEDSGKVWSNDKTDWFFWEVLDPDATGIHKE